jgi:hypothetical protein
MAEMEGMAADATINRSLLDWSISQEPGSAFSSLAPAIHHGPRTKLLIRLHGMAQ